ncbi:hypothetical protein Tco_0280574, partial [Tanacetum coccineum]
VRIEKTKRSKNDQKPTRNGKKTKSQEQDKEISQKSQPDQPDTEHPLKNMVDRCIFDSGCSGHMTGNKDQLEDFEEFNGGSVTFGGSKGYISGKGRIRVDFKMPDENQILLKVPRHHNMYSFDMKTPSPAKAVKIPEEKDESRTSSTNSKKEETLTEPQKVMKDSSTDLLEDNLKIQAFRRELEEIALKHFRGQSLKTTLQYSFRIVPLKLCDLCLSAFVIIQRISLTGFPAQSVGSSNTDVLDLPCLLGLITGTSQSRQHGKSESDSYYLSDYVVNSFTGPLSISS